MAELDLPTGPAELLEAVLRPLGHHLGGERHLHLGGGTALATRWRHRQSTDVDLFVDPADHARLAKGEQQFRADFERHTRSARNIAIEPGFARIVLADGGEVSLSTSPSLTADPVSEVCGAEVVTSINQFAVPPEEREDHVFPNG